jgi:two-component system, LytTR family, sensor kinase
MNKNLRMALVINYAVQIIGWLFFLGMPIYNHPNQFLHNQGHLIQFLLQHLVLVAFFYINYFYLLPVTLNRHGLKKYLIQALVLFLVVFFIENIIINFIQYRPVFRISFITVMAQVQLFAIGTTLRMLTDYILESQRKKLLESEKLKVELAFLRSQINPHFLFNTLNNINSLIQFNPEKAQKSVIQLSAIMRYMLNTATVEKIRLSEEIVYINNYIELQKLRLPAGFKLIYEVIESQDGYMIEPLLLIGFIENAFKHALSDSETDFITIRVKIQEHFLILETINSLPAQKNLYIESGIGIKNIHSRLDLLYANKYWLEIKNENNVFSTKLKLNLF